MTEPVTLATVTLSTPITRQGGEVETIQLRRPNAGELRGLSLVDVTKLETEAMFKLIPRISMPFLTEAELATLNPVDWLAIATEIAGFFSPSAPTAKSSNT